MTIAVFETDKQAELYKVFMDNLTIKKTDYGLFIETYGKIDTETHMGNCHYGQSYSKDISETEAKRSFVNFYFPMNLKDNEEQA